STRKEGLCPSKLILICFGPERGSSSFMSGVTRPFEATDSFAAEAGGSAREVVVGVLAGSGTLSPTGTADVSTSTADIEGTIFELTRTKLPAASRILRHYSRSGRPSSPFPRHLALARRGRCLWCGLRSQRGAPRDPSCWRRSLPEQRSRPTTPLHSR